MAVLRKILFISVGHTEMHKLLHASLQVRWIWIHRELRLVLDILPYHDILTSGGGGAADGEQKTAIEADLEESQDFPPCGIFGKVAESREADGEEGPTRIRVMRRLNTGSDT